MRFLKVLLLGDKFSQKAAQMNGDILGYFEKHNFSSKSYFCQFLGNFRKIWATLLLQQHLVTLQTVLVGSQILTEIQKMLKAHLLLRLILTSIWPNNHCDQIGRFLQVLGTKVSHESSPNILVTFWAISNNVTIM